MSTNVEKIASGFEIGKELVDNIYKVASENVLAVDPQEVANAYFSELEANGVNLEDPQVQAELEEVLSGEELFNFGVQKEAEAIAEDIVTTQEKIAGGESVNYQTASASKAVEPFLTNDGAANFGSAFGMGNGPIGSVVNSNTDKNVFGGWGALIGQNIVNPRGVNAAGKVSGLLGSTNMKYASDEEAYQIFTKLLKEAADEEGQTVDEFVYDLGQEALVQEVKEANKPNGKVAEILEGNQTLFASKKLDSVATKEATDLVFAYVEEKAAEANVTPEEFIISYGLQKAAEYLDESVEAEKTAFGPGALAVAPAAAVGAYGAKKLYDKYKKKKEEKGEKEASLGEKGKSLLEKGHKLVDKGQEAHKKVVGKAMDFLSKKKSEKKEASEEFDVVKFAKEKLGVK